MGSDYSPGANYLGLTIEKLTELLGMEITTLLGCDIISEYKVLFDYKNRSVIFSDKKNEIEGSEISLTLQMGVPLIKLMIENKMLNFYLDTGAKISYLKEEITENFEKKEVFKDFHPIVGKFETATYDIITTIGDINFNVKYGNLPEALRLTFMIGGTDGIIGKDFFCNFKVLLDIGNYKLKYSSVKNTK